MNPPSELVDTVHRSLNKPGRDAVSRWCDLERSWPHDMLVSAARIAVSRTVWALGDVGPVGVVTGSGGVIRRLPNVSTAAALVASCVEAVRVVKPGARASRTKGLGPGGLASRLGLLVPRDVADLLELLERDRFAVLDTSVMYPWLDVPEAFTVPFLCEALDQASLQPCDAEWKVNGVVEFDPALHFARCRDGDEQRTLIVHGRTDVPGLAIDDVSTAGTTYLLCVDGEATRSWSVEPEQIGVSRVHAAELIVPSSLPAEQVFVSILDGMAPRAWIDLVAASAAAVLLHARAAADLAEGYTVASGVLSSGTAMAKLSRLREAANHRLDTGRVPRNSAW